MKIIGIIVTAIGFMWAVAAFKMDTSVESGGQTFGSGAYAFAIPVSRVNNIGLMEERRNHLMLSGFTMLAGVILFGFGAVVDNNRTTAERREAPSGTPSRRPGSEETRHTPSESGRDMSRP
jgi:hypothetical protein